MNLMDEPSICCTNIALRPVSWLTSIFMLPATRGHKNHRRCGGKKGHCNQNVPPQNPLKIIDKNLRLSETSTFLFLKLLKTEFTLVFYKDSAPTEDTTRCAGTLKKHRSMFYREIMADCCENRMQQTDTAWAECRVSVHKQRIVTQRAKLNPTLH